MPSACEAMTGPAKPEPLDFYKRAFGHQTADKLTSLLFENAATPPSVILALVAGIQRPDVCRVKRLFQPKDLG